MKRARKIGRALGYLLFLFLAVVVLAELALQTAALFVAGREEDGSAPAKRVIVAVGDSHTYGLMVPAEASYPARLQALLDEQAPDRYQVVNLGIPATNTGQALDRLRLGLKRYRPRIVIVWCGVNNVWNRAEPADSGDSWASRAVELAARYSRVYRLVRVWRHDRRLESVLAQGPPEQERYEFDLRRGVDAAHSKAKLAMAGQSEEIEFVHTGYRVDPEMEERAFRDYSAMLEESAAAGAWTIFLTYPIEMGPFAAANRAVRRVFDAHRVPVVETWKSLQRLPPDQREFLWAGHPNSAVYGEIALDVLPVVLKGKPPKDALGTARALLARLTFETELKPGPEQKRPPELLVKGDCALTDAGCASGKGCYRWRPRNDICYIQQMLTVSPLKLRLSARFRVAEYPGDSGGREVLTLLEGVFGSGVSLEFTSTDRLRLHVVGSGNESPHCGPLPSPIARDVWYGIRLQAEKSDRANLSLELVGPDSRLLDSLVCTRSTGGSVFTHLRIGSANPSGSTADIVFDDVEVTLEQ
jgi:hypothetical protein